MLEPVKALVWLAPEERERLERERARERAKAIKSVLVSALKERGWQRGPNSIWSWQGQDLRWCVRLDKGSWGPWHVELRAEWPAGGSGASALRYWVSVGCDQIGPEDVARRDRFRWALDHHDPEPLDDRKATLREIVLLICGWAEATPSQHALAHEMRAGVLRNPTSSPETRKLLGYEPKVDRQR